jgi:methionyl-tRNA formyltransferase
MVKVWETTPKAVKAEAGIIKSIQREGIVVGTGNGVLVLHQVQAQARKRISGAEFARGYRLKEGDRLG